MKSNYRSVPTIGKRLIGRVFARFLLSVSLTFAFTLAHAQPAQEPASIENVVLYGIVTMLTLYVGFCIALFCIWWKVKEEQADQLIVASPENGNELSALSRPLEQLGVEDRHRY